MRKILGGAITAAAVALAGCAAASDLTHTIDGTAVVNTSEVSIYTDEMKAQAEAEAAAAENAYLDRLETITEEGIRQNFADDPFSVPIRVGKLTLLRTGPTTFEGMIALQAQGYSERMVRVHVTDDGRNSMWQIDPGALLPLFVN